MSLTETEEHISKVKLLFFAKSRELSGASNTVISVPTLITGAQLLETVLSLYPSLLPIQDSVIVAVNQEYIDKDQLLHLKSGDEFTDQGRSMESRDLVTISPVPISQQKVVEYVTHPSAGGISIFIGTTRDSFQGRKVLRLEYEAYTSMAVKQLHQLCSDIRGKWPVCKIAIIHRTGVVPVCEASVMIAVSAEHRKEAIEAVAYAIDSIKSTATIWKKEVYEDEAEEWKENKECVWLQAENRSS